MEENPIQDGNDSGQPAQSEDIQVQPVQDYQSEPNDSSTIRPIEQPSVMSVPETPQPVVPTGSAPIATDVTKPVVNSPGLIVLQWLTYAFWGWTVLAMSFLTVTVIAHFVNGADVGDSTLYSIAAVLVLIVISVVCDIFYIKYEPEKKTGASSIVMIIHAVIFALFGIGAIVTVVFSLVNLYISSSGSENTMVVLYSALIIAFLYAVVFLRTILPKKMFRMRSYFIVLMVLIVGVIITLGIMGPVAEARVTRSDKLIEANIDGVQTGVDNYVAENKKLPNSLTDVKITGDVKKLVSDNLVTYKNDGETSGQGDSGYIEDTYRYQLCVTYAKASENNMYNDMYNVPMTDSDGYGTNIPYYSHSAGATCYKLKTSVTTDTLNSPL